MTKSIELPLQLFMKDLLDRSDFIGNEIVVDNARTPNNSTPERKISRVLRSQRRRWEMQCRAEEEEAHKRQHSKKIDVLDVSDHSKKDSRWASSMTRDNHPPSPESSCIPLQVPPPRCASPSVYFENTDNAVRSSLEKDTAPQPYPHHGRGIRIHTLPVHDDDKARNRNNAYTLERVDEAIAICGFSATV